MMVSALALVTLLTMIAIMFLPQIQLHKPKHVRRPRGLGAVIALAVFFLIALIASATAAPVPAALPPPSDTLFKANELTIGSAYTLRTEDLQTYRESVTVAADYFVTAGAGFHAGVGLKDFDDQGIDMVEFGLTGRVPFDKIRTAALFGIGAEHGFVNRCDAKDPWSVYAEAGLVNRISKYVDVFAKVRGVRPIDGAEKEHIAFLLGLDIPIPFSK